MYFITATTPKKVRLFYNKQQDDLVLNEEKTYVFSSYSEAFDIWCKLCIKYKDYRIVIPNATENFPKTKEVII